ncbi:rab escort protein [Panaeolus papilionaceus]|nr:rab escort protein [Panaeolus papilionaceus]
MEENQFDVVVIGTGLLESITASAISKAGYKVAHLDPNPYYGAEEATFSLEELAEWIDKQRSSTAKNNRYRHATRSENIPPQSRQYAVCLQPSIIPSIGPMISSLVASGVAKYSGFRLLDCLTVYDKSGALKSVPGSKEDIFRSKEISLLDKRRLMRFLTFASSDFEGKQELEGKQDLPFPQFLTTVFSLKEETSNVIAYSLAFCLTPEDGTLPALIRLRHYLRSSGRYGPSPFLIGHYGGTGDIAQGFCRASAVSGGVYILGREITGIACLSSVPNNFNYALTLSDFPDTIYSRLIIAPAAFPITQAEISPKRLSRSNKASPCVPCMARSILIIDRPLASPGQETTSDPIELTGEAVSSQSTPQPIDTGILIFPPDSVQGGSLKHPAIVLVTGEGSLSTPKGKWIVYIGCPVTEDLGDTTTAEDILKPYKDTLLSLSTDPSAGPINPLFEASYLDYPVKGAPDTGKESTYIITPTPAISSLADFCDDMTDDAEATFREVIQALQTLVPRGEDNDEDIPFWPPLPTEEQDDEW